MTLIAAVDWMMLMFCWIFQVMSSPLKIYGAARKLRLYVGVSKCDCRIRLWCWLKELDETRLKRPLPFICELIEAQGTLFSDHALWKEEIQRKYIHLFQQDET